MEGLEKFKDAFEAFADNYVIIGGTACSIVMTGTAVRPRATHDIDMIVIVEKMTPDFAARFWQFVREAGYRPEPKAIVTSIREFVASIRNDWAILGPSLSNALGQDETFVETLVDTLDNLFIPDGQ